MRYAVLLTAGAEQDLRELHNYLTAHASPRSAARLLERLVTLAQTLARTPARGTIPDELRELGISDFRQVFFKPYRVIYRVVDRQVIVYLIADGRRDLQSLLARRLLRS